MKKAAVILIGVALVVALVFFGLKVKEFSSTEHGRFQKDLWQLKQLDTQFNGDLLEVRFALLDNYDDFQDYEEEMRRTVPALSRKPSFISPAGRAAIDQACADYMALLRQRLELFDRFKSRNAMLANSRRYLPLALDELARRLGDTEKDRELAGLVNDVARLSLLRMSSTDDLPGEENARLQKLKDWRTAHSGHPEAGFVGGLSRHAQNLLAGKGELDTLTRELLALPTATVIERLFHAYDVDVAQALQRSQQYRTFLYLLSFVLVAGIGYGFWALRRANRHLESRVRERTSALETEVSERKATAEKLNESLRSLAAVDAVLDRACIIARTDLHGTITYVNDNFCQISEYNRGELTGQNHRILKSDEHPDSFFRELWQAIAKGDVWRGEIKNRAKSGRIYWVDTTIGPILDDRGRPKGYMAIRSDITERKRAEAEARETSRRLIDTSRRAGMAEVATGVLHNVGNALNSLNVSANLVAESLKKSKVASLPKLAGLLNEHAADLFEFLTADARGRQLPGYLGQLAEHLTAEREMLAAEMDLLRKHVEHINEIVAMHQDYANVSGVNETVRVSDLIEDALRLNGSTLTRQHVKVIRSYEAEPVITADKHKVLQVLVNLIRNAMQACDDSSSRDQRLSLQLTNGAEQVKISVTDNGVGIPAENLTRIFNHGFTTRPDGHGMGLHNSALAAQEIGGSIRAHSDGPGRGATFFLELPRQPPPLSHA